MSSVAMSNGAWQQCSKLSGKNVKALQTECASNEMTTEDMIEYLESKGAKVTTSGSSGTGKLGGANGFTFNNNTIEKGGIVITQVADCFPASAKVLTKAGAVTMAELKVGDSVQAYDVSKAGPEWSIVTAFTHREPSAVDEFLCIATVGGLSVKATPEHRIFTPAGDVYTSSLKPGDAIFVVKADGAIGASEVASVHTSTEVGLYCPLTAKGTIVVDDVAYSCHANCTHSVGNILFWPLRWARGSRSGLELDGIHPYSKAMAFSGLAVGSVIPNRLRSRLLAPGLGAKVSKFEAGELKHYQKPKTTDQAIIYAMIIIAMYGVGWSVGAF